MPLSARRGWAPARCPRSICCCRASRTICSMSARTWRRPAPTIPRRHPSLRVTAVQTAWVEKQIDHFNEDLAPLKSFVLPGGTPLSSALHIARTVTRRAERIVVELASVEPDVNPEAIRYLNRLSDLLFVLGRVANNNGDKDVLWVPGNYGDGKKGNQRLPKPSGVTDNKRRKLFLPLHDTNPIRHVKFPYVTYGLMALTIAGVRAAGRAAASRLRSGDHRFRHDPHRRARRLSPAGALAARLGDARHLCVPACRLAASSVQHAVPVDFRRQYRRRHGPCAFPRLLSRLRRLRGARPYGLQYRCQWPADRRLGRRGRA